MMITIQAEVFAIALIAFVLFVFMWLVNRAVKKSDVYAKPKGLVLVGLIYYKFILGLTEGNMNKRDAKVYAPYVGILALFLVTSNLSGLVGLSAQPTANLSVTLTLALITWIMIQRTKIVTNGFKAFLHGFIEPIPPFIIPNIFGFVAPLISMSMRLFGNITSGGTIMGLIYTFTGFLSSFIPLIGGVDVIGILVAPVFHFYFDVFSGLIQTYIFLMLTTIFIGNELPQE
jgi:F-type H+-transporting ATPase subunit a